MLLDKDQRQVPWPIVLLLFGPLPQILSAGREWSRNLRERFTRTQPHRMLIKFAAPATYRSADLSYKPSRPICACKSALSLDANAIVTSPPLPIPPFMVRCR